MTAGDVRIRRALLSPLALLTCFGTLGFAGCADRDPTTPLAPDRAARDQVATGPVVNTLADPGDGSCDVLDLEAGTDCTLREAIAFASTGATITFAPGLTGTITLAYVSPYRLLINKDLVIDGPGADVLAVSAGGVGAIFTITNSARVVIRGLTVRDGWYVYAGIRITGSADVTLDRVRVTNNAVQEMAGPLSVGAGIDVDGGRLTLIRSTVDGNRPDRFMAGIGVWRGGSATLVNSTVSGNALENGTTQAALMVWGDKGASHATVVNSTLSGYVSVSGFDASAVGFRGSAVINGSCYIGAGGSVADDGYNVAETPSCGFGGEGSHSLVTSDALLGPLADNGGPTPTHALLPGSPLLDRIPAGVIGCGTDVATDQRGVARPQGDDCDIGAFEARAHAFDGFFAPVENLPVLNEVKAGRAVPLKFSLGGDQGLAVLAAGYPTSEPFACEGGSVTSSVTETATAGQSGLSYDALTDTYTYVWKTDKSWANSCRRLTLRLSDEAATTTTAEFRFVK